LNGNLLKDLDQGGVVDMTNSTTGFKCLKDDAYLSTWNFD